MKKTLVATVLGASLVSGTLVLTGVASAAPTGPGQVEETVRTLEASGYNVVLNRTGSEPLSACTVKEVRPGQTHRTVDSRGGSSLNETVIAETVYVDLAC